MKYSIIIPTMWKAMDCLLPMLYRYDNCPMIGEILLINNQKGYDVDQFQYAKLKVLNNGNNLYVNPSWNLGTASSKFDRIIIANDDIVLNDPLEPILKMVNNQLKYGTIFGFSEDCFIQRRRNTLPKLGIRRAMNGRSYGYGVFMIMLKESYKKIPNQLMVWYGDDYLYKHNIPYLIEGVDVITEMRRTSRTLLLNRQRKDELNFYKSLHI